MKTTKIHALQRAALAAYKRVERAGTEEERKTAWAAYESAMAAEDRQSEKRAAGWLAEKQAASWDGGADDNRPAIPMTAADEQAKRLMTEQRSELQARGSVQVDAAAPVTNYDGLDRFVIDKYGPSFAKLPGRDELRLKLREKFGGWVSHKLVRDLRREHAPLDLKKGGAPTHKNSALTV